MRQLKLSFLFLFICLTGNYVQAQLQDSSWKGVFFVPDPAECVFEFKKDTVNLRFADNYVLNDVNNSKILEQSLFKIQNDTLILQKLSGESPCNPNLLGKYQYAIKDEKLFLTVIWDDCRGRVMAFPGEALDRIKE